MFSKESLLGIQAIVEASQSTLGAEQQAAVLARQNMATATYELGNAEVALEAAHSRVDAAKASLVESQLDVGAAHNNVANAAHELAALIVRSPGDSVFRTLFGLIYQDDTLARNDDSGNAYTDAAQKGEAALTGIIERLRPGEPVLHIGRYDVIVGIVPEDEILIATPPKVTNHQTHTTVSGGSIDILLTKTVHAFGDEKPFVATETLEEWPINLINSDSRHNVRRLIEAGENTGWLVLGSADIAQALERAEPWGQFVAMTALKAAGVDVAFVLDEGLRADTEAELIAFVMYLATGELPNTHNNSDSAMLTAQDKSPNDDEPPISFTIKSAQEQRDPEAEFEKLSRIISGRAIRSMAQVLGLDKEATKVGVEAILQDLAKDSESFFTNDFNANALDTILASIFDS